MIDPVTGWIEIKEITTKRANVVANVLEMTWLTCYPRQNAITLDRGKEFMAEVTKMIRNDYGMKKCPITVRNPQANSIVERVIKRFQTFYVLSKFMTRQWMKKISGVDF